MLALKVCYTVPYSSVSIQMRPSMSRRPTPSERKREATMTQSGFSHASTGHEGVYHATHGCQAAPLPLTAARLRGRKRLGPVASKKTAGIFAARRSQRVAHLCGLDLGCPFGVSVSRRLKGGSL